MELIFLGTGTSTGVPMLGCHCPACMSTDSRDKRLRASVIIKPYNDAPGILIDAGPDLRYQLLRENTPELTALLVTHIHYDHVGGIDDLRPYCYRAPNMMFPVYCREEVGAQLKRSVPYAFPSEKHYPGAPTFDLRIINDSDTFYVPIRGHADIEVQPLKIIHGQLPILGFRIGSLAYITDCSSMPESTLERLSGIDTLVINALQLKPHMSHFSLEQALAVVAQVNPKQAYLTHIGHSMPPTETINRQLPANVHLAIDCDHISV